MWRVMVEGAKFSLIAQSMVFLVLFLLAVLILVLKLMFYRPGKPAGAAQPSTPETGSPPGEEQELTAAAIAAALEMHRQGGPAETPAIVGQEGPWAVGEWHDRAETLQSKSRRWGNG